MTHMFISSFLEMTTLHIILYCGLVSVTHCSRLLMMTNNNRKYLKNLNGSKKYIIGKNLLVLHTSRTKISFQRFSFIVSFLCLCVYRNLKYTPETHLARNHRKTNKMPLSI